MNHLDTTVFQLLSFSLFQQKESYPISIEKNNPNWSDIFEEMKAQTVASIVYESVINNPNISGEIKNKWMKYTFYQVGVWTKVMAEQNELVKMLRENNISVSIFKGSAAAVSYPKPEYRTMGDVDFIVKKDDFKRTCQLMLDNGYVFSNGTLSGEKEIERDEHYHVEFKKNGIIFELHKRLAKIQDDQTEADIQIILEEGLNHIEFNQIEKYQFPMYERQINGLILLRHIVQHLGTDIGLGLRQIVDWMMYVNKYVDDDYWYTKFEPIVAKAGLKRAAITFTKMCQIYLGLGTDNITWCEGADISLCRELMDTIMDMGNFGVKSSDDDAGANVFYKNKSIFTLLGSLQKVGIKNWKAANRHKILRPFAWMYQICRYVTKAFGRKSPIKTLKMDMQRSHERKSMIARLEIKGLSER